MKDLIYGLDFGTSNTALSVWDAGARSLIELPELEAATPTLIYYPANTLILHPHIGADAISNYISSGMTGRFFQAIKTILPEKSFTHTRVNGHRVELEDLIATVIRHFKLKADHALHADVKKVVMGRPAVFHKNPELDTFAQKRLEAAAHRAGFTQVAFQYEPIAAALDYESALTKPQTVLVGDFGGGTSDFTVMRLDPAKVGTADRRSDIIATGGVPVAGNKFDSAVMRDRLLPFFGGKATYAQHAAAQERFSARIYAHEGVCEWDKIHHLKQDKTILEVIEKMIVRSNDPEGFCRLKNLINHNLGFALFQKIEGSKIALSKAASTTLQFSNPHLELTAPLTRPQFEESTHDEIQSIAESLHETLARSGQTPAQIDAVFLTGGTAQIPAIRALFETTFGASKLQTRSFFTSVARGLGLSAPLYF